MTDRTGQRPLQRCCFRRSLSLFWLLFFQTTTTLFVHAAHSRRRIVVRQGGGEARYDRTITDFSGDGRLAQVEYAMEAALRGSTIAAMNVPTMDGACFVVDASSSSSSSKVHRIDHHIWLVTAGLSGDARVLAQDLRAKCQNHRLSFGEPPTTEQVAHMAGEAQHELTRTAGLRPLGCTALVVGMDHSNNGQGTPRLFETDPGGIVEECQYAVGGKGRANLGRTVAPLALWLAKEGDGESPSSLKSLGDAAAGLAELVLNQMSDPRRDSSAVDVWTLRPDVSRRGGMHATCYRNIEKKSLKRIIEQDEK
jgi:20S proteasome alpha/beta subunit